MGAGIAAIAALSAGLVGCGPKHLKINPSDVVSVSVRPASGQKLFCPGDPFQIELAAKMKDGSTCSNVNGDRGCLGQEDVVIDPDTVKLEATSGMQLRGKFIWMPDPNPLTTAASGLTLKGFIQTKAEDGKVATSMTGESHLTPVYQCMRESVFTAGSRPSDGQHGAPGPNLQVAITTISTPYYPNAALIRVDDGTNRVYLMSSSFDEPVRIISKGQNGGYGAPGPAGARGQDGSNDTSGTPCAKGQDGQDGADGGPGGPGGDGGPGGSITVLLDDKAADKLRGRVLAVSEGGAGGPGGPGGPGGQGGRGGSGGPTSSSCSDTRGKDGRDGRSGHEGQSGRTGPSGPGAVFQTAPRSSLFAGELAAIQKIEASPRKK
jgi:hypothetical protein